MGSYTREDFAHSPLLVFYEVTRACDLVCRHCRASAMPRPHPDQLTTEQSGALLDAFTRFPKPPMVVFTGGDPMKRPDLLELIRHGVAAGLKVAVTPSPTSLVTEEAIAAMREAGACGFAVSLDGACAETHDAFRGFSGSFEFSMKMIQWAARAGLPVQVNTTITPQNVDEVEAMADRLSSLGIEMWSVFFLVPVGRGRVSPRVPAHQYEFIFEELFVQSRMRPFAVKTTEAPHYRRFVMQEMALDPGAPPEQLQGMSRRAPVGTNDGRGVMFVSHIGEIYPSGFLPLLCGTFPKDSPVDVYQHNDNFLALRDASRLHGKCGACEYREICGGSRARAYALTGDPLASEPDCVYVPPAWASATSLHTLPHHATQRHHHK